jgi:radical SAM/Cys-rich protein
MNAPDTQLKNDSGLQSRGLDTRQQLEILGSLPYNFSETIQSHNSKKLLEISESKNLAPRSLEIFQMNIGKWCNQACLHCHVNASPQRTEFMDIETINQCLGIIASVESIHTVDITGGAPEGNPHFRYLVKEARNLGKKVIDRCNLTILSEPGMEDLHHFLSQENVEICSSLPHFSPSFTDRQRGDGVFQKSIQGLQKLNSVGYGKDRTLNLVYNPTGLYISSSQAQLEYEFREVLDKKYGIQFHHLFTINNMPINRYLEALVRKEKFSEYMELLVASFNPATLSGLMCLNQISVSYDGKIYDCDFNQMLDLESEEETSVKNFDLDRFLKRKIVTANHCFGCTAGSGSSCGGELV